MDEHEKRLAELRAKVDAARGAVATARAKLDAADARRDAADVAWEAAYSEWKAADDAAGAVYAALVKEDRYPEPADMSGPDGPVADSSDGYKIRPGEEERRG